MISYLLPVSVILTIRLFEELIDEIRRFKRDRKLNREKYLIYDDKTQEFKEKLSQDIKEGDIVKIYNQRVPADMLILRSR